jgi:CheY-like chemotaxis protein
VESQFANSRPRTVMIIDDDEAITELLVMILNRQGLNVVSVASGQEGLDFLVSGNTPDLIITDMMMPEMDGVEFLKRVRSNPKTRDIPVIVSSALEDLETKTKLAGAITLLKKPYTLEKFASVIRENLH